MRPIRLELRGFTSFRDTSVVDFTGRRLVAITGPTGSGKSSLLDAITWALYGEVPRVGNRAAQLMTHGAVSMSAQFDFSVGPQRYRVSRSIGRKSEARLDRLSPDGFTVVPLADRAREATAEVTRVLGLDYETFTKTVLLPQGAFDAFLRGDPGQRRDILTNLLALGIYERMRADAHARSVGARAAAEMQHEQAGRLTLATPEAVTILEADRAQFETRLREVAVQRTNLATLTEAERAAADRARIAADAAQAARVAAEAFAHTEAAAAQAVTAAEAAAQHLAALTSERAALGYDAEEHRRLEQQVALVQQRAAARDDLSRAQQAVTIAQDAADRARGDAARAAATAETQRVSSESATTALAAARTRLAAVAALAGQIATTEAARAQSLQRSNEYEQKARVLQTLAKQLIGLRVEHERADSTRTAALAAAATAEAHRVRAHDAETAAAAALTEATAHREAAQREHAAAALRRGLKVGEPCPVCGEPITSLADRAAPDLDATDAALAAAQRALDAARAGQQQRASAAAAAHAHAEAAGAALTAVDTKIIVLDAQCAEAAVTRDGIDHAAKRASTAAAAEGQRATAAEEQIAAARTLERDLQLLLVQVPADIETIEADPPSGALTAALRVALDAHAEGGGAARIAETATRTADEAARTTTTAATHSDALTAQATRAAVEAQSRLDALGAQDAAEADALLASLAAMTQRAQRATALDEAARAAGQQQAFATALTEERRAAVARATAAATTATANHGSTEAEAARARDAYREHWRAFGLAEPPSADDLTATAGKLEADERDTDRSLTRTIGAIELAHKERAESERLRAEAAANTRNAEVAAGLEQELHRNRFVAYVQREAMHVLATEAGERMEHLSRGRYRLAADGDEFVIVDRFNGDEQRSVKTLSGGETFLASLALALALAERLPQLSGHGGALSLESLFLDEGFGTLDADALDVAIEALELLSSGDRMIGVISHVPAIADRLPDRIEVIKNGATSTVRS